jgi:hypothetical protein
MLTDLYEEMLPTTAAAIDKVIQRHRDLVTKVLMAT